MDNAQTPVREATVSRDTLETQITVSVCLDGTGKAEFDTGLPFLEHMLDQIARHGMIDLNIKANGDLHIDAHHTVEDIGITLGQALAKAVGDRRGILRYGHAYVPLDEALSRVVIDFSGRPSLHYDVPFTRASVGDFDVDLFAEFFHGLVNHAHLTLHIDNLKGENSHHQAETLPYRSVMYVQQGTSAGLATSVTDIPGANPSLGERRIWIPSFTRKEART